MTRERTGSWKICEIKNGEFGGGGEGRKYKKVSQVEVKAAGE